MVAYLNRPDFGFYLAFNANPNDTAAVPTWVDFTSQFKSASDVTRGRQYELAQTLPAAPQILLRDRDEFLNPENPSSPYFPNVDSYRAVLWQGLWPNGGTGNLLNLGMWTGNKQDPIDPSFDSYTVGTTPSWLIVGAVASTPVISTTTPHAGANCLSYTIAAAGGAQGVAWDIPCMPGRQYTASAWVRQSAANTSLIYTDVVTGSSTTTTGAYVRLTVTFTATQPIHQCVITSLAPTLNSTVLIDDIMHTPGGAPGTNTTAGPVIYPIMANYAERFTKTYQDNAYTGYVSIPCVDALAALASVKIQTEYRQAVLGTKPAYWWTLSAFNSTGTSFTENSGGPPLVPVLGVGTPNTGSTQTSFSSAIPGDPGGTAVAILGNTDTKKGLALRAAGLNLLTSGPTWSISLGVWARFTDASDTFGLIALSSVTGNMSAILRQGVGLLGLFSGTVYVPFGGDSSTTPGLPYNDGNEHFFLMTNNLAAGTFTTNLYVDGVLVGTAADSAMTSFGTNSPAFGLNTVEVSSGLGGYDIGNGINGVYAQVAVWSRALTSTEVTTLYQAGAVAGAGETSGQRIRRHLILGGYNRAAANPLNGGYRISTGNSIMEPPTYTGSIDLATDSNNTAVAEGGTFWIAPDGAVVFEGRQDRWLRTTPKWTFGNSTGTPFLGNVELDTDPTFVYANVEITRNGGGTMIGGATADILAAGLRYFYRSYTPSVDLSTDAQTQDYANWTFYTHWKTGQRIAALTIDVASNPSLWPVALGSEVGQRARFSLVTPAANAGAGFTNLADFFVETVSHGSIDMDAGTWLTTFLFSPVGSVGSANGITSQPWILGDSTYGVLGVTTIPGW